MRYSKIILQALMVVTVILSSLTVTSYAQQERQAPAQIGDLIKLESVRGKATHRETDSRNMLNASMVLTGELIEINRTRVLVNVIDGNIKIGENMYTVETGLARVLFKKFGWVAITGNATDSNGISFRFHLEGLLHVERQGLVIVGLTGPLTNETSHFVLRLVTRMERVL